MVERAQEEGPLMKNVCIFDGPVPSEQPGTVCLAHEDLVCNGLSCLSGCLTVKIVIIV